MTLPVSVKVGLGQPMLKVVYDVDDVLWPLNERVFANLGLEFQKDITYNLRDNNLLTPTQQSAVLDAFHQADTFREMNFYPGAKNILQVEALGATVRIHSHCYTEEIAELKRTQIQQLLPEMKPSFIKMAIIADNPNYKQVDADAFVFVDDNPYNIITSKAPVNVVPRQPWNTTATAAQIMTNRRCALIDTGWQTILPELISRRQHCIIMARNLREVNQIITQIVKLKQEANHGKS